MTQEQFNTLKKRIAEKIKQGEVLMRPRWHFVLKAGMSIAGVVIVFLGVLYLFSFIVFTLRVTGVWFVPLFGFSGVLIFLSSLPWLLLFLSLVFIVCLEFLVKKYSFAYRNPLLYSLIGLLILIVLGSVIVSRLELHERLWGRVGPRHTPLLDPLYRGYSTSPMRSIHPVVISSSTEQGFFAVERDGDTIEIIISPETRLPAGFDFSEGDEVVILGEKVDDAIHALGVAPMRRGNLMMRERRVFPPFMRTR